MDPQLPMPDDAIMIYVVVGYKGAATPLGWITRSDELPQLLHEAADAMSKRIAERPPKKNRRNGS